jgi:ectoine hydroxylase-related dioxygenase (phytanoyl-CoA dioxygenase family)
MTDAYPNVARYGVHEAEAPADWLGMAEERIRRVGYAVVDSGLDEAALARLRDAFDRLLAARHATFGTERLAALGEADLIRCPLADSEDFLALAANARILALSERMIGPGFILNQQNGILNPAGAERYSQSAWHRDLPYQHFVSTRPIALNALFCLDTFSTENGATYVLPASQKEEAFPSAAMIASEARQVEAPAGSFIVLDCMTFHCGGANRTAAGRRAVNHVYSIALLRQQIDLVAQLGEGFTADARLRALLGFGHPAPRSIEEFIALREHRARPSSGTIPNR